MQFLKCTAIVIALRTLQVFPKIHQRKKSAERGQSRSYSLGLLKKLIRRGQKIYLINVFLFINGVLVFEVSKVWLVPSSLIHELIVHQGSYTFLRVEEPHFALVWKGAVSHLVSKLSIWLPCSPLKVSNFLIEIKWDLFIVQSLQHNLH